MPIKQFILISLYVFCCYTHAQTNDLFHQAVKKTKALVFKDASKALIHAKEAMEIAEVQHNSEAIATAGYLLSKCYHQLGQHKDALIHLEFSISKKDHSKDIKALYKTYYLKGSILSALGDNARALEAYLTCLTYAKVLNDSTLHLAPLDGVAKIKKIHKDFQEAIALYKDILQRLNSVNDRNYAHHGRLVALMNIADAYLWLNKTAIAETYNEKGLQDCSYENVAEVGLCYTLLMNKAIIHYQRNEFEACNTLAMDVKTYSETSKKTPLYFTSLYYLGKSMYELENYQTSITYLEKALDSIHQSEYVDINQKEIHQYLGLNYNKSGNPEKSLFHFEKYSELVNKQSLEDLKINNKTHLLVDMKPLQKEVDTLGKQLHKENSTKTLLLVAAIALLVLFVGSILFYKLREKHNRNKFNQLLQKVTALEQEKITKKSAAKKQQISDDQMKAILDKISEFEEKEYFLYKECSLAFVAEKLETNTSYISKAINTYRGKSFTSYITELRINAALVKLKNNTTLQSYTIQAIAEEFGFKRQETFAKAFKQYTGIYPSQYIKNLQKQA